MSTQSGTKRRRSARLAPEAELDDDGSGGSDGSDGSDDDDGEAASSSTSSSSSSAAAASDALPLYERIRLKNIARNEQMAAELGLQRSISSVSPSVGAMHGVVGANKKVKTSSLRRPAKPRVPEGDRRRSSRVAGNDAPDYSVEKVLHGGRVVLGGADSAALLSAAANAEASRPLGRAREELDEGPLALESTGGTEVYGARFLETLRELAAGAADQEGGEEEEGEEGSGGGGGACDLAYAERMAKLSIAHRGGEEATKAKVTPERIFGLGFVPVAHKLLVAAGDKLGGLGLWDVDAAGEGEGDEHVVSLYYPHAGPINEISFDPHDPSKLITMSYDNSVRRLDVGAGAFERVAAYAPDADGGDAWLQHGALAPSGHEYFMAASDGNVACVDLRAGGRELWRFAAHGKKVNTVSLGAGALFCTASLDRSVKLWDARMLRKRGKKTAQPLFTCACSRSINSAFFNGPGDRILSVGQANHISLFHDLGRKSGDVTADASVAHNNQTGRYLTVFRAVWDPKTPSAFVTGSMAQPRQVEVYSALLPGEIASNGAKAKQAAVRRVMSLQDPAWMKSVQSRNCFHPFHDVIASGNASGWVHIFRDHSKL